MHELIQPYLTDARDRASFAATPILPVPRFGTLPPLPCGGVRYLVAEDGLYIEARTAAMHACARVSTCDNLPCGTVATGLTLVHGGVPTSLIEAAVADARRAMPNEWAGAIVIRDGRYQLFSPAVRAASAHRIHYDAPNLTVMPLVMDLHSHGAGATFFSGTDDIDDLANPAVVFVAGVVGHVNRDVPKWSWRVVINGRAFDMNLRGGHLLGSAPQEKSPC